MIKILDRKSQDHDRVIAPMPQAKHLSKDVLAHFLSLWSSSAAFFSRDSRAALAASIS
jgi:hypothetical protein